MIDEKYKGLPAMLTEGIPWVKDGGLTLLEATDNHVKMMIPKDKHLNHVGIIYAGSLFMLMEVAGAALMTVTYPGMGYVPINKGMSITFSKPGLTDMYCDLTLTKEKADEMIKPIEESEKKKGDWVLEMTATDENGTVCATSVCTYYLKKFG